MNLIEQIEVKRAKLIEYSLMYGFTSQITIQVSQELDKLINIYQLSLSKHNKKPLL